MPAKKGPDASTSVPCFYGAELRFKREQAGLKLEQLVEGSFRGISFLSQIERGERGMPMDFARHADERLGTDGEWAPDLIPGLLQTEAYMRVLMQYADSSPALEEIEQRVRARLKRAELWGRDHDLPRCASTGVD
ncbi:Scr1 family TA system antitoxin-like transcriptional regulator [Streptomyces sp. HD]|uniref:Scr1 family TA system antitoxin-like transcriptional regulator n=1 Tax=Streptomyces sp. HD TaxID=3020892 RepID=UPI002330FF30|nr:Scr1 family TA system antitoxin-like transcriptional regulator [Streptomyces sp. HD]MDC0765860.1 Scr1 family TA system antitoxin-like transcriptional regulator [Streptomyces sp. HD]